MTKNEIDEWREAQKEKCRACHKLEVSDIDNNYVYCRGYSRRRVLEPFETTTGRDRLMVEILDEEFCSLAFRPHNTHDPWHPVLAATTCVGYQRRPKP